VWRTHRKISCYGWVTVRTLRGVTFVSRGATDSMSPRRPPEAEGSPGKRVVLILSSDAVAAALLGALVETLGYLIRFYHPPEDPEDTLKRERPSVAMVDCDDPTVMKEELLGRARMRGISVVIFGTADALRRVRQLASEHKLDTLLMPASLDALDETLKKAVQQAC
jgi:DNA-binding NtrC family response regulator